MRMCIPSKLLKDSTGHTKKRNSRLVGNCLIAAF